MWPATWHNRRMGVNAASASDHRLGRTKHCPANAAHHTLAGGTQHSTVSTWREMLYYASKCAAILALPRPCNDTHKSIARAEEPPSQRTAALDTALLLPIYESSTAIHTSVHSSTLSDLQEGTHQCQQHLITNS